MCGWVALADGAVPAERGGGKGKEERELSCESGRSELPHKIHVVRVKGRDGVELRVVLELVVLLPISHLPLSRQTFDFVLSHLLSVFSPLASSLNVHRVTRLPPGKQ